MDREEIPIFNIANTIKDLELTREYCKSRGITDEHDVKKIQWLVSHHIRVHGMEGAREELERRVSQSKRKEHNEKWLNEAGILPDAQDIQKANNPSYDPAQIISAPHPELKQAVKQYAHAIQRVDELKALIDPLQLELEEAQKALNEWHIKTINIINTANYKFQKWMGSE
jgi:hypothetical protein